MSDLISIWQTNIYPPYCALHFTAGLELYIVEGMSFDFLDGDPKFSTSTLHYTALYIEAGTEQCTENFKAYLTLLSCIPGFPLQ